ncbi:T9SS type A sorting domain-containing protein [Polaribacter batillariae]|uniref:T9SS type A sorting domain-containing protein n=1 Tax=Polaribacter batillariae TaxID=2808900 RepID=A0ABX7SUF5_9FLAO|nr:T9SS type A sorting domain-containing protein [Polaribacter batillariae]QTD37869.1 T9SS type A sorting domain-containing protein [Polaribacter batillariae]
MKNKITFILLFFFSLHFYSQNWEPLGISSNGNQGVYDLETHHSVLFASVNNDGFIKSLDNGASWVAVGQTEFVTNPNSRRVSHIKSAGNNLYVATFFAGTSSSMIYKSSDNGATFTEDINGLPVAPNDNERVQNLTNIYYHNGYLITVFNGGNYIKHENDTHWQAIDNAATKLSEYYDSFNNILYAFPSYALHKSTDNGQTWTKTGNTNLPQLFLPNNFNVDPFSGRIYVSGRGLAENIHKLFYSDDEGETWTSAGIESSLGNNWIGQPQIITEIFSHGNLIQLGLANDANNSGAEMLISTDSATSFQNDKTGFANVGFGTSEPIKFVLHSGFLYVALNYNDIYKKNISTLNTVSYSRENKVSIYPNPVNSFINISIHKNFNWALYNTNGIKVKSGYFSESNKKIEVNELANGVYFLKLTGHKIAETIKFIKE